MHTHNSFENLKPFVKWVGGKGSSVERLLQLIPEHIDTYVEPFVGSGALFFSLNFDKAIINDSNSELIAAYQEIKTTTNNSISVKPPNRPVNKFFTRHLIFDKFYYNLKFIKKKTITTLLKNGSQQNQNSISKMV